MRLVLSSNVAGRPPPRDRGAGPNPGGWWDPFREAPIRERRRVHGAAPKGTPLQRPPWRASGCRGRALTCVALEAKGVISRVKTCRKVGCGRASTERRPPGWFPDGSPGLQGALRGLAACVGMGRQDAGVGPATPPPPLSGRDPGGVDWKTVTRVRVAPAQAGAGKRGKPGIPASRGMARGSFAGALQFIPSVRHSHHPLRKKLAGIGHGEF